MDQARIAGLGNLLVDEVLWRAGIDPARDRVVARRRRDHRAPPCDSRRRCASLGRRGGSHMGDHMPARFPGGLCPRDGTPFERRTVGGRTTYSCPLHQR